MSVALSESPVPLLRAAIDSNPPAQRWPVQPLAVGGRRPADAGRADLHLVGPARESSGGGGETGTSPVTGRPDPRRVRRRLSVAPGGSRPDRDLPDVTEWSALLSVAVLQVLSGRRPLAQLGRWLTDAAVSEVGSVSSRRRRSPAGVAEPAQVVSVRVQCVQPRVAEVAVHVRCDGSSAAIAFRLEGSGDRWSCTAIDFGPAPVRTAA